MINKLFTKNLVDFYLWVSLPVIAIMSFITMFFIHGKLSLLIEALVIVACVYFFVYRPINAYSTFFVGNNLMKGILLPRFLVVELFNKPTIFDNSEYVKFNIVAETTTHDKNDLCFIDKNIFDTFVKNKSKIFVGIYDTKNHTFVFSKTSIKRGLSRKTYTFFMKKDSNSNKTIATLELHGIQVDAY